MTAGMALLMIILAVIFQKKFNRDAEEEMESVEEKEEDHTPS